VKLVFTQENGLGHSITHSSHPRAINSAGGNPVCEGSSNRRARV
jgi:hypothetical protein